MKRIELAAAFLVAAVAAPAITQPRPLRPGVVQPIEGERVVWFATWKSADAASMRTALQAGLNAFRPTAKHSRRHIRQASRHDVHWETEVPVTDPHERRRR